MDTRLLKSTFIVLSLFLALPLSAKAKIIKGTITKNVDGDTVWVEKDRSERVDRAPLKIRFIGIDAPESHLPSNSGIVGQGHFGDDAADYMSRLLPIDSIVTVEDHGLDKYKRTLGRVIRRGSDINLKMVEAGWAITYILCDGASCKPGYFEEEHVEDYISACEQAQDKGLGIFNPKDPLTEMPFEFRLRMQNRKAEKFVGNYETKEYVEPEDYDKVPVCKRIFFLKRSYAEKMGFTLAK
jgi:endonuclease YncB( thermonuclease family)